MLTSDSQRLLQVAGASVEYSTRSGAFRKKKMMAVDDVSLRVDRAETVGIVGESGCGKSTLARAILQLVQLDSGKVSFMGRDLTSVSKRELRELRRSMQVVMQDPYTSLNPRLKVQTIIEEPLLVDKRIGSAERMQKVAETLRAVGMAPDCMDRYPAQFSGGQRQRIAIARAVVSGPSLIVCDEPVSSLDVATQAQIVELLIQIQESTGVSYLFIGHDLPLVQRISHRLAVMYLGRIVEEGPADEVLWNPAHPYTAMLVDAIPNPFTDSRNRKSHISDSIPDPFNRPSGCRFNPRCPHSWDLCSKAAPGLEFAGEGRVSACHLHSDPSEEGSWRAFPYSPLVKPAACTDGVGNE